MTYAKSHHYKNLYLNIQISIGIILWYVYRKMNTYKQHKVKFIEYLQLDIKNK